LFFKTRFSQLVPIQKLFIQGDEKPLQRAGFLRLATKESKSKKSSQTLVARFCSDDVDLASHDFRTKFRRADIKASAATQTIFRIS